MQVLGLIWRDPVLRMIGAATLLYGAFSATFTPYLSLIGIGVFGLSDFAFAVLMTVTLVISVTAALGVGIVTDQRATRKPLALAGAGCMAVGMALVWLGNSTATFVIAHALVLPFSATVVGQIYAVMRLYTVSHHAPELRDGITSAIRALFAVPFAILLPLWAIAFDAGLPLLRIYPAMLGLSLLFLWLIWRHWPADATAPWVEEKSALSLRASLAEVLASSIVWRLVAMGAVHSGSVLMGVLLALLFDTASGRGPGDVGLFFGAFVFFEVLVMLGVGSLGRYLRRLHIICIGAVFYALFLGLLPVLAPFTSVWFLILPAALGGGMIYGLSISYLQDLLSSRAGAGSSLVALQRLVSEGMAALIFAIGTALAGYALTAFIGAVLILCGAVALLLLDRNQ
ncbi:hypothetical protein ACJ5NV_00295 [Loktanella agnita]|uniref:hypothetical protein n=1 Tax=Loktanella agnita TaxID=287097 RepID=UPI00398729DE